MMIPFSEREGAELENGIRRTLQITGKKRDDASEIVLIDDVVMVDFLPVAVRSCPKMPTGGI